MELVMVEFKFTTSGSLVGSGIRSLRRLNHAQFGWIIPTQSIVGLYQGPDELWLSLPIEPSSISHKLCNR